MNSQSKLTFSARKNADDTYRGLVWRGDEKSPIVIVGIDIGENYFERKTAIAAAKAEAKRQGIIDD
jgi:hypothetical protein